MNHTNLPWKLIKHEAYFGDQECWTILDNEGNELMDSEKYYPSVPKSFEIWERIVNSVNTHDELLEALKASVEVFKSIPLQPEWKIQMDENISILEKVITKAEGK